MKCPKCENEGTVRMGSGSWYCDKHYRFQQIRHSAHSRGKEVPSLEWLEVNWPKNMECPACHRQMTWRGHPERASCITIQHDREGSTRFLCYSCNVRHARYPDDSFYAIPEGHKPCFDCHKVLPLSDFDFDRRSNSFIGRTVYCRECSRRRRRGYARKKTAPKL